MATQFRPDLSERTQTNYSQQEQGFSRTRKREELESLEIEESSPFRVESPYYRGFAESQNSPNPLSSYIATFLDVASASLKQVVKHSPTTFATGVAGYYMPAKILAYAGMTASQLGSLALITSIAETALKPVIGHLLKHEETSKNWKLAVHVVNTAVVTACIATAFGVALPTAKGMVLTGGLILGVKYAVVYMQSEGSRNSTEDSRLRDEDRDS